jgi:hypothetical protein
MKTRVILSIIFLGIAAGTAAYPITPRPLRKLILESEVIVWADVLRIEEVNDENQWTSAKAILYVNEKLQSHTRQDTIAVFFSPNMICPAPAHYEVGTSVLAFLRRLENKGEYVTHALSYGAKTLDVSEYQIYKQRILEMHEIMKITDGEEKVTQTIDWLLTCALNPATRWEGIYELSPQSDFMSYYDEDLDILVPKAPLTKQQKALIRKTLFSIDTLGYTDLGMIDLLATEKDVALANFLVEQIALKSPSTVWYRYELFIRIKVLTEREGFDQFISAYSELDFADDAFNEKADRITDEFVEAYHQKE